MVKELIEIDLESLLNEQGLIMQEIAEYKEGLRRYWFDSDLQIQIRENIDLRQRRLNEIEALMCN